MSDNDEIQQIRQSLIDELDARFAEVEKERQQEDETIRQKNIRIGELQKEIARLKQSLANLGNITDQGK